MPNPNPDPFLKPWVMQARGALQALRAGQREAAWELCQQIPTELDDHEAWRRYAEAQLTRADGKLKAAEEAYLRGAAIAERGATAATEADERKRLSRLAGLCYHRLGTMQVGASDHAQATRSFKAAWEFREDHGSHAEQWETAIAAGRAQLGAAAPQLAMQWLMRAVGISELLGDNQNRCSARSWQTLAEALTALGQHQEAVSAAMNSRTYVLEVGNDRLVAASDVTLGDAFKSWAKATVSKEPKKARRRVEQALEHYESARRALVETDPESASRPEKLAAVCRRILESLPR